jgi:hypothetical protein
MENEYKMKRKINDVSIEKSKTNITEVKDEKNQSRIGKSIEKLVKLEK